MKARALALLTASALAACSGGAASTLPPVQVPAAPYAYGSAAIPAPEAKKKKAKQLLYVSTESGGQVSKILVFDPATKKKNPAPIATITDGLDGTRGLAVDRSGNVYAANSFNATVTVYAPNSGTPKGELDIGLSVPTDVKVDGFGNVYVLDTTGNPSGTNYIVEYSPGSSNPSYIWTLPGGETYSGIALIDPLVKDKTFLYALGYSTYGSGSGGYIGGVVVCSPDSPNCTSLGGYTFGKTGGIAVAQSPIDSKPLEFLAVDASSSAVDYFENATLKKQFFLDGNLGGVALNSADGDFFVTTYLGSNGGVLEYSFPAGKEINAFAPNGYVPFGVATSPSGSYH